MSDLCSVTLDPRLSEFIKLVSGERFPLKMLLYKGCWRWATEGKFQLLDFRERKSEFCKESVKVFVAQLLILEKFLKTSNVCFTLPQNQYQA